MSTSHVETKYEEAPNSRGQTVITRTLESFTGRPTASGAKNLKYSHSDGRHVVTYDTYRNASQGEMSVEGSMSQEPIETHEEFKSIAADEWKKWSSWKNNPQDESIAGWTPDKKGTDKMKKLHRWFTKGITDYLVPKAVVRITKSESTPPNLSKLGKRDSPQGAPSLPSGANWLMTGATGQKVYTGENQFEWDNTYEYTSSGPAGWDAEVY
jgi:hypothetical protein